MQPTSVTNLEQADKDGMKVYAKLTGKEVSEMGKNLISKLEDFCT